MPDKYELPAYMLSRVRYFDGQFLKDSDFIDEQKHNIDRRDRHQRLLHVTGVAEGMGVTISQDRKSVTVAAGTAVDSKGRSILLSAPVTIAVAAGSVGTQYLEISFREKETDMADAKSTVALYTRFTQDPLVTLGPSRVAGAVPLADLPLVAGTTTIANPWTNSAVYSGVRLPGPNGSAITLKARTDGGGAELSAPLRVTGTVEAASFALTPIAGDPAPTISVRTVPDGQGAQNERTELILFHGNDSDNGYGPDVITLRAPSIRLQTYNDSSVVDISNAKGSVDRLTIDPAGKVLVSNSNTHLTLRREKTETTGGPVVFLELYQDDSTNAVANVYPNIRFQHGGKYGHRIEARNEGFHFKNGDLADNTYYRPIVALSATLNPTGLRANDVTNILKFGTDGDYQLLHKGATDTVRNTLAMHVHTSDAFGVYSTNYTRLMDIAGGTGDMYVKGTAQVSRLTFPAPPGDPAPVIAARTVPDAQDGKNERTELILFHGNDGTNSTGPDLITLRAPSLRLQTYDDATVVDIGSAKGSNDRLTIDPGGTVGITKGLAVAKGAPVSGIQVIDFMFASVSVGMGKNDGARSATKTVTFPQPVVKAGALLRSWKFTYSTREYVGQIAVETDSSINGNDVAVTVYFTLRDNSGPWDDQYSASAEILVIALLSNAI